MGIAIGSAVMVLVANIFNHLLGWEISAIIVGLVVGLEAGFWTGAPTTTKLVHEEIYDGLPELYPIVLGIITLLVTTGMFITVFFWPISLCITKYSHLLPHTLTLGPFYAIIYAFYLLVGMFASLGWFVFIMDMMTDGHDENWFMKLVNKGTRNPGAAVVVALIGLPAGLVAVIVCATVILFGPIVLVVIALRAIIKIPIALVILCGKHETATIGVGVTIGGLTGLAYGWTHLALPATSIAMVTGAAVGMATGWLLAKASAALQKLTEKPAADPTA